MVDLTIIVPAYNVGSKISITLDSIFSQKTDYTFEVLCINGPSTDNTKEVVKEYSLNHPNLIPIDYEKKNLVGAREVGIYHATGRYITFCDGDDRQEKDAINTMVKTMDDTDSDVLHGSFYFEKKKTTRQTIFRKNSTLTNQKYIEGLLKDTFVRAYLWVKVFKSEILKNAIIYVPENNLYREDTYFNFLTVNSINKVVTIKKPLYYYNKKEDSIFSGISKERSITFMRIFGFERYMIELNGNKKLLNFFRKMKFRRFLQYTFDLYYNKKAYTKEEFKEMKIQSKKWLKILINKNPLNIEEGPWKDLILPYEKLKGSK